MKRSIIFAIVLFILLTGLCLAENIKSGSLQIISESTGVEIYVDGELIGKDVVKLPEIQAGSHLIKAIKGDKVIYNKVVSVPEGNFITVMIEEGAAVKAAAVKVESIKEPAAASKKRYPSFTLSTGMNSTQCTVWSPTAEYTSSGLNLDIRYTTQPGDLFSMYTDINYFYSSYSIYDTNVPVHSISLGFGPAFRFGINDNLTFILTGGMNYSYSMFSATSDGEEISGTGTSLGGEFGAVLEYGNFALEIKQTMLYPYMTISAPSTVPEGSPGSSTSMSFYTTAIRAGWMF
ncbi:hypothetical protein ACFL57_05640 [Candidatus Margulisiibacteriota bacterium]